MWWERLFSTVQRKVGFTVFGIVLAYALLNHLVDRYTVLPDFSALENRQARQAAQRVRTRLQTEANTLERVLKVWAVRADLLKRVQSGTSLEGLLTPAMMKAADIQALRLVDTTGKVLYQAGTASLIPESSWRRIASRRYEAPQKGYWLLPGNRLAFLAIVPIYADDTTSSPSPLGFLEGLREISPACFQHISRETGTKVSAIPVTELTEQQLQILSSIREQDGILIIRGKKTEPVNTFQEIRDIRGNPCALLRVEVVLNLADTGLIPLRYSFLSIISAGIVALLVLLATLRRAVTAPLGQLTHAVVRAAAHRGTHPLSFPMDRYDEIGILAHEFDRLIRQLERELSEREAMSMALQESETRVRAILETAPDGILSVDETARIVSANPAAETLFASPPGGLVGLPLSSLTREPVEEGLRLAETLPEGFSREATGIRLDGTPVPVYQKIRSFELQGRKRYTVIFVDMTEYRRMHEKMLRAEHLAAIGEMGAQLAHEIRNPITAIGSAVQVLDKKTPEEDPRKEIFAEILDQVRRLDHLVHSILMIARPWTPNKQACDLHALIHTIIKEMDTSPEFQSVRIHGPDPSAPPCQVFLDPDLFRLVVINLLQNACQAMQPEGGDIRITAAQTGNTVTVTISDTGPGIPKEIQARIFQPFFTTKTRGTGLGLAICRQIMEAHGGILRVESKPGKGSVFILEFPGEPE